MSRSGRQKKAYRKLAGSILVLVLAAALVVLGCLYFNTPASWLGWEMKDGVGVGLFFFLGAGIVGVIGVVMVVRSVEVISKFKTGDFWQ